MLARVIRETRAVENAASVTVGSTMLSGSPLPAAGSHPSVTANSRMSSRPSQ
jgi:hypothetical protein